MEFERVISQIHPYTMESFINVSTSMLPQHMKVCPWNFVNHGTELLKSNEELCAYISAYGEMHEIKCRGAFQNIDFEQLGNIEIWDWGCGQGLATLTLIDMLREREKLHLLKKVTLVEPSLIALERAELNIKKAFPNIQIITINKYLPADSNSVDQIRSSSYISPTVIHLFSNILDIDTIDLVKLAHIVASPGRKHYIMCVGPLNYGAYRLDQFASIFNGCTTITHISNKEYAYTSRRKRVTCKANCFIHDGSSLNHSFDTSIKPILQDEVQMRNDYDIAGWFHQYGLYEKAIPFYERMEQCKDLNEHDSIFLAPEINGEKMDIVLVRPGKGILILKIYEGRPDLNRIKDCMIDLKNLQGNLMRKHLEDVWGKIAAKNKYIWSIVRMAILFPDCSCNEIYSWLNTLTHQETIGLKYEYVGHQVPCGFDFVRFVGNDSLTANTGAMQLGWFAPIYNSVDFGDVTYQSIMRILSPSWHSYKEGKGIELDNTQQRLTSVPNVTKQINGVAGSGKTQVLVQRAVNTHLHTGNPVLILSYNIALANYIRYRLNQVKADFGRGEFTILSYHRFFKMNALSLGLKPTKKRVMANGQDPENLDIDEFEFSYDDISFFSTKEYDTKRFDNIFIDEIQDFNPIWIEIIKRYFLSDGGEIVVLGDASQNIYHRPLDNKGQIKVEVARNGWNNSLTKSHRFLTHALSDLVIKFHKTFITNTISQFDTTQASLFEEFNCLFYHNLDSDVSAAVIGDICNRVMEEMQISSSDVAIVSNHIPVLRSIDDYLRKNCNRETKTAFATIDEINQVHQSGAIFPERDIKNIDRSKKIHFTVENQCVKISSIHSFKGWETPNLILIIEPTESNSELIYTALTRARERVIVINCGNKKYHSFFSDYKN
ncbi:MAG: UvrD-helicase domain-containing protein [Muribaculum sp.]|nr:UvrD-helicase domain-containing protein [Muribaculum sp.]